MELPSRAWRWVRVNPLSAFILLSVGIHLVVFGILSLRRDPDRPDRDLIRIDLRDPSLEDIFEEADPEPLLEPLPEPAADPPPPEEIQIPEELPLPEEPPPAVLPEPLPAAEVALPKPPAAPEEPEDPHTRILPDYISALQAAIDRQIQSPPLASRQRREGEVMVVFTLHRSGRLRHLAIAPGGESPFAPFNREAIRAVNRAGPTFRPFPDSIEDRELTFRLPIIFSLR